jgi:hypothetical protein
MSFYEQHPSVRLKTPNASEIQFDAVFGDSSDRWGLDHPPFDMQNLSSIVRYAPDRIMARKLVECKGLGKDGVLKIKIEQLEALRFWDHIHPVAIFIWDAFNKRWTMMELDALIQACHKNGALEQFPDNHKPAWFIHINFLDVEWTDAT